MTVSVIVPVFNVEKYVEKCVRSIMAQTVSDIEIILIDDGSRDASAQICDNLAKDDDRIRVIHQKNQGVSVARNEGIKASEGEWICFVDGDDYVHPQMLEKLLEKAEEKCSDICISDYYVVRDDEDPVYSCFILDKSTDSFNSIELIENCMIGNQAEGNVTCVGVPWAKIYRKSFIDDNKLTFPVGLKRNQDVIFNLNAFSKTERISYCKFASCYYRVWSESAVNKYSPDYYKTVESILTYMKEFFDSQQENQKFDYLYNTRIIYMFFECLKLQVFHKDNPGSFSDKYREFNAICKSPMMSLCRANPVYLTTAQKLQVWLIRCKLTFVDFMILYLKRILRGTKD